MRSYAAQNYNKVLGGELRICKIDKILRGDKNCDFAPKRLNKWFFRHFLTELQSVTLSTHSLRVWTTLKIVTRRVRTIKKRGGTLPRPPSLFFKPFESWAYRTKSVRPIN